MTKLLPLLFLSLTLTFLNSCKDKDPLGCEHELILQPDADYGKDAYIHESFPNNNAGKSAENLVVAWTFRAIGGEPGACRSLIQFDLSALPEKAIITNASLSLYYAEGTKNTHGGHSTINGSNEAIIYRVTEDWYEHDVTWNTQPAYDANDNVYLPASTSQTQDYTDIDLTEMVEFWYKYPSKNQGMLIKLLNEQYYRALVFASSDHANNLIRPKLMITYEK